MFSKLSTKAGLAATTGIVAAGLAAVVIIPQMREPGTPGVITVNETPGGADRDGTEGVEREQLADAGESRADDEAAATAPAPEVGDADVPDAELRHAPHTRTGLTAMTLEAATGTYMDTWTWNAAPCGRSDTVFRPLSTRRRID